MKLKNIFGLALLLSSQLIVNVYADITLSQVSPSNYEVVAGTQISEAITGIKAGSIRVSSANTESITIRGIEVGITGNGNPDYAFIRLNHNGNQISDYYRFSNGKTKVCFSSPITLSPGANIDLDLTASFGGGIGGQYMFSVPSIDSYDVIYTYDFGKPISLIELRSDNPINTKFQDSGVIIKDSCNIDFKTGKNPNGLTHQSSVNTDTVSDQDSSSGNILIQNTKTPIVEPIKEYSIDINTKDFRKSKLLSVQTDFKAGTQVIIYKIVKSANGGTRDIVVKKVKVGKNGKVTYRLLTIGKYKIVQQ